jgi:hypothetical protein
MLFPGADFFPHRRIVERLRDLARRLLLGLVGF